MTVSSPRKSKRKSAGLSRKRQLAFKPRNAAETKERILQAAIDEFSDRGFMGARVERIVRASQVSMRMVYHYFENKEALYTAALERVYTDVRVTEKSIDLAGCSATEGIGKLIDFTFWHFAEHPELINLVMSENLIKAEFIKRSDLIPEMNIGLQEMLTKLLEDGRQSGEFRGGIDPVQLWVTIFSLCWTHLSNRYTLSWMLQRDLEDNDWLQTRCEHVKNVVLSYLQSPPPR